MNQPDQPSGPGPATTRRIVVGSTGLALMLAALAMLGPFAVDTYLPAFPAIQASLNASPLQVQQTLTAYMLSFGIMTLWHGALSDSYGRRNIILFALAAFGVASLACASVHSVEYLWIFRVLQGVSAGAGVVIGRAIIRDMYSGAPAAKLLSLVTMIFSIAPAIAPIMGGWIVKLLDWRSIFIFLFFYTALLLWYCYRNLPETLPPEKRQPFNPHTLWTSYRSVFRSQLFHLEAGTVAFNFAGLFLYVAAAPVFITQHLGLGADEFAWQFVPSVGGIFCGALAVNRLAGRTSIQQQARIGFCLLIGAAAANVVYHLFLPPMVPWSVLPLFFYTFGMSMVGPGATLLVLDLFPEIRGIVASCQSCAMTVLAAAVSGLLAPVLWGSVLYLAAGQLALTGIALCLWMRAGTVRRRLAEGGTQAA